MKIPSKNCSFCKKRFKKSQSCSRKNWKIREFCSRSCHYLSKRERIITKCDHCNETFERHLSHKIHKRSFCSMKCYGLENRGSNNSSFGGVQWTDERRKKWSKQLKKAFEKGDRKPSEFQKETASKNWTGKKNPNYTKGEYNGYQMIKVGNKWIQEHRYLMEQKLGRRLIKGEIVHHINHNKLDNRIENLMVMTIGEHVSHHQKGAKEK